MTMTYIYLLTIFVVSVQSGNGDLDIQNIGMTAQGVFHSLESIFEVFRKPENRDIPQVISLMAVFQSCSGVINLEKYRNTDARKRNAFVVIEGLQASGSRYFASRLVRLMRAHFITSPPACLSPFRKFFDKQNIVLRSAFYALGNYIVAEEVKKSYYYKPVIMNRYWHSQAAIALSYQTLAKNGSMLPLRESAVYKWPKDLLIPDIVLLLTRQHEIHNPMWSNKRLVMTKYFRSIMTEAYLRMKDPVLVDVDGGMFQTRTYATLRMLINATQERLHETYSKYNLTAFSPTMRSRIRMKYRVFC